MLTRSTGLTDSTVKGVDVPDVQSPLGRAWCLKPLRLYSPATDKMKLERAFPVEDPAVELPWGLPRTGIVKLLEGARAEPVADGRLRLHCRILKGLVTSIDLHFEPRGQRRFRQVELLRTPSRNKRKGFADLQSRLEAMLGPGEPMEELNPAAYSEDVKPHRWRVGRITVTHDFYHLFGLHEKVLFDWRG